MRTARIALVALVSGSIAVAAGCGGSKSSGSGSPTPTDTPVTGSITAVSGAAAELASNGDDTPGSTFSISLTANGQNYTDTGIWNCFGPLGGIDSYDFFFDSGTMITSFDINIPSANWSSNGAIAVSVAGPVTGYFSINNGADINITGGSINLTSAPTVEDSGNNCAFSLATPLTFDSTM